jgi:hypothetical protein
MGGTTSSPTTALRLAAQDARRFHKRLGNPIATWRNGQVVWIRPEDIDVGDEPEEER